MQESRTGQVKLPDDEPGAFAQVVYFAYYGKMEYEPHKLWDIYLNKAPILVDEVGYDEKHMEAVKVYFLAQKLGMEDLQNWCIDRVRWSIGDRYLNADEVALILENSLPDQPMLRLALHATAYEIVRLEGGWDRWKRHNPKLYRVLVHGDPTHHEMLTRAVATHGQQKPPWVSEDMCRWHVHPKDHSAPACSRPKVKQENVGGVAGPL